MTDTVQVELNTGSTAGDHGTSLKDVAQHYQFTAALAHHIQPYPAVEYNHQPMLILDLGSYAVKNFAHLSEDKQFGSLDVAPYQAWASELSAKLAAKTSATEAPTAAALAQAMAVADHKSVLGALPQGLSFLNHQTFFSTIALLLMASVLLIFARRKPEQVKPANGVQHVVEATVLFVRDQIVRPNLPHGDHWTPYFAALFIALATMNVFGLMPIAATATGNPGVTVAFALTTLFCMIFFGLKENGFGLIVKIVPVHFSWKPMDAFIWVLLFFIELLGFIIKPAALAIRLFANMFAGHSVLLAFASLGFIVLAATAGQSPGLAVGMGIFGFTLGTALYFLELLIALLQAYVFVMLSAAFIGMTVHPEH